VLLGQVSGKILVAVGVIQRAQADSCAPVAPQLLHFLQRQTAVHDDVMVPAALLFRDHDVFQLRQPLALAQPADPVQQIAFAFHGLRLGDGAAVGICGEQIAVCPAEVGADQAVQPLLAPSLVHLGHIIRRLVLIGAPGYLLSVAGGKVFFHLQQLSAADLLLDVRHLPPSRLVFCQKPRVSGGHRFGGFPLFTLWCTPSPFRGGCIFRQMRE